MITAIVAIDNNLGIGYNNQLLEYIPKDIRFFQEKTMNNIVIMGRKTYESLPYKPLPNRLNIVISNTQTGFEKDTMFMTYEECIKNIKSKQIENAFIIGGETIYKLFLPYCNKILLTHIYNTHEKVDSYFPNIFEMSEWTCIFKSAMQKYGNINYQFKTFSRK